jgi:hypothetical protein
VCRKLRLGGAARGYAHALDGMRQINEDACDDEPRGRCTPLTLHPLLPSPRDFTGDDGFYRARPLILRRQQTPNVHVRLCRLELVSSGTCHALLNPLLASSVEQRDQKTSNGHLEA